MPAWHYGHTPQLPVSCLPCLCLACPSHVSRLSVMHAPRIRHAWPHSEQLQQRERATLRRIREWGGRLAGGRVLHLNILILQLLVLQYGRLNLCQSRVCVMGEVGDVFSR